VLQQQINEDLAAVIEADREQKIGVAVAQAIVDEARWLDAQR
jgi:hypothetical protein